MAAYPKPTGNSGIYNNQSFVNPDNQGGLTVEEGKKYFVTYPTTQSPSTITANNFTTTGALNVAGASQFGGDATFIGGATITGPLTFSDNVEVQGTTTLDDNLLCLTTATIDGELTCGGNILMQPISPATNSIIDFVNAGGVVQLYLDPSSSYDMVFNSAQAEGVAGLSVINATSSFTMQCSTITTGIVGMRMLNPINMNNNALYGISNIYTGTSYTTPIMTVTTTALNMNTNSITNVNSINIGTVGAGTYTQLTQGGSTFGINNTYPYTSAPQISLAVYNASNNLIGMTLTPTGVAFSNLNLTSINNVYATTVNIGNTGAGTYSSISQSSGQCLFNNNSPYATSPQYNFALYTSTGYASIFNISPALTTIYTNLTMNGNNINNVTTLNSGGVGGYVTTNTPTAGDNSGKIATTSYVTSAITAAQGTAFTDFTFINIPISGNAVTLVAGTNQTSIQTTNVTGVGTGVAVQFLSTFFQVNIASQCTAAPFFQLAMNVPPWPSLTPGKSYSGKINGIGSNYNGYGSVGTYVFDFTFTNTGGFCTFTVTNSNGATLTTNYYYQFNLMSLGFFNPT
jgi:hypothetical protein